MTKTPTSDLDLLRSVPLFKGLSPEHLLQAQRAARRRNLGNEEYLFYEGDEAESFYLLIEGRVKLTQVTPEGQQIILRYGAAGEPLGIMAVLSQAEYPVTAQAVEDSRLLSWDHDTMRQLMLSCPQVALNAIAILTKRMSEFQDRVRELSTERVERRIARALLRLARQVGRKTEEGVLIDMALSRQDLAQMTGTTLFTVSRTLSQWETKGLVKSGREQITMTFPHGLVSIAEDLPDGSPPEM